MKFFLSIAIAFSVAVTGLVAGFFYQKTQTKRDIQEAQQELKQSEEILGNFVELKGDLREKLQNRVQDHYTLQIKQSLYDKPVLMDKIDRVTGVQVSIGFLLSFSEKELVKKEQLVSFLEAYKHKLQVHVTVTSHHQDLTREEEAELRTSISSILGEGWNDAIVTIDGTN